MNTYKLILTGITFAFFSNLQAHDNKNDDDFEFTSPFKKEKTIDSCCILNINDINYIEVEQDVVLGFDPYLYLPVDFNPYEGIELDLDDIHVIEEEQEIDLGFDVNLYLPENFDPHACVSTCDIK